MNPRVNVYILVSSIQVPDYIWRMVTYLFTGIDFSLFHIEKSHIRRVEK